MDFKEIQHHNILHFIEFIVLVEAMLIVSSKDKSISEVNVLCSMAVSTHLVRNFTLQDLEFEFFE